MLSFRLDTLSSKELFRDVLVRLINGDELALNYFELKSEAVAIPFHEHPVEHLVIVLEGKVEFMFKGHRLSLKERDGLFLPAGTRHSARVIRAPVKALEIYTITKDEYYEK
ncbi:MAG: cupin domain-containing protein [Candidatus Bathyarchaeia archaeon]